MDEQKKARLEFLIEKFISDIRDDYQQEHEKEEESVITKTVSAMSPLPSKDNSDIDQRIANLEDLITKLQSEITNISLKSQKSDEDFSGSNIDLNSNEKEPPNINTIIASKKSDHSTLNLQNLNDDKKHDVIEKEEDCRNVGECAPKNVDEKLDITMNDEPTKEASKKFDEALNQLLNVTKKFSSISPTASQVKNTVNRILENENEYVESNKDGLEELINELKSEIADKLDDLKDVEEPCDNQDNKNN